MRGLVETGLIGEGAAYVANPLITPIVNLLLVVIVLLISPSRGAATEPAR